MTSRGGYGVRVMQGGGYYNQYDCCGLFFVYCYSASSASPNIGSRLQELP